jgi:hypothetical protein
MAKRKQRVRDNVAEFLALSDAEKDRAVAEFDRPFSVEDFGRPSSAAKAQLRRAKRKGGRPRIGRGAKRVLVTIERGLLSRTDRFAKAHGLSRAQLVARGLETYLKQAS